MSTIDAETDPEAVADGNGTSPIKHRAAEAELLVKRMVKMAIGDTISYETMAEITGHGDIQTTKRYIIASALRALIRLHSMVFECIMNVGYRRCSGEETVENSACDIGRIRRAARRGKQKLGCWSADELTPEARTTYYVRTAQLNIVDAIGRKKRVEPLELAASKVGPLKLGAAVSAMFNAKAAKAAEATPEPSAE